MPLLHWTAMGSYAPRSPDPVVGRLVDGRYRVTSVIARGGMATVYRADDTRLDRMVALKVMHRSFAEDAGFVARFEREARAAAKLNDPHVVGVFDQGAEDGLVWLAMDYVPGHPLREVIRVHAPLDPDRALGVVEQILSGLIAAHSAGFIHRDIKPENVLMTPDGTMKITDFGLARAMIEDDSAAATKGVLIGTVAYLAPEQVDAGHADERSDVYATGIVLFELLTGTVPFVGPTPLSVAYRHVNDRVPPPSSRVAGIPADVDALVLRATAQDPAQRFPSALAFLQAAQAVDVSDVMWDSGSSHVDAQSVESLHDGDEYGPGAVEASEQQPTDVDEWERIAAVATPQPGHPPVPPLAPNRTADAVEGADSSTSVIDGIPPRASTGTTHTNVLPNAASAGPNAVSTSALGSTAPAGNTSANVVPTTALWSTASAGGTDATEIEQGATSIQPNPAGRRGPTPLTPVTRRPPADDAPVGSVSGGVKSVSRFGRTKLVVLLVILVALMATGGWWLGMQHNATDQTGLGGVVKLISGGDLGESLQGRDAHRAV